MKPGIVAIVGNPEGAEALLKSELPAAATRRGTAAQDVLVVDLPPDTTPEAIQELARELRASPSVRRAIFCTDAGEFDVFGKMPPKPLPMAATMMLKTMPDEVYARLNPEPASLTR